jgi:release factor glutamine methyltransferase
MSAQLNTVRQLVRVTTAYFAEKGVASARLNAERLLADALGLSRLELYFQHDRPVVGAELARYRDYVRQRATGVPLQTILGETEFYSRPFKVEAGVFIPRPETERLVEAAIELLTPADHRLLAPVAVEVGCGTGVIAVTLAVEIPQLELFATDAAQQAVDLARHNAHRHGVAARVHCLAGNRFDPLPQRLRGGVDLLVSNPPYIRRAEIDTLPVDVAEHDPRAALDGGEDGLVFYRALAAGAVQWLRPGGRIAVEIGADQGEAVAAILTGSGAADIRIRSDYAGLPRVVTARLGREVDTE